MEREDREGRVKEEEDEKREGKGGKTEGEKAGTAHAGGPEEVYHIVWKDTILAGVMMEAIL